MIKPFPQESLYIGRRSHMTFYDRLLCEFAEQSARRINQRLNDVLSADVKHWDFWDEPIYIRLDRIDLEAMNKLLTKEGVI